MRRLWLRRVAVASVLGLLLAGVGFGRWIFQPSVASPTRSDALVILGPSWPWRTQVAEELMRGGAADVLVISAHPADTRGAVPGPCRRPDAPAYPVICFDPDPSTTRGEARAIARIAREHGWRSVQVLTFRPQISRARLLVERCYEGQISMLESVEPYSTWDQLLYQTGATVKAMASPGC